MTVKKTISVRKRYALWKAHGGMCYYCGEPLRYREVCIDHILPEGLIKEPQKLRSILEDYGLEQHFNINDYDNWLPSHARCNLRKGDLVFEQNVALYYITLARRNAPMARQQEKKSIRNLKADRLLGSLHIALDEGLISKSDIRYVFDNITEFKKEPFVITFGLLTETVLNSNQLPDHVPKYYPHLCDWLESDLIRRLQSIISCGFSYTEPSLRTGDSLSVRLAFVDLDEYDFTNFVTPWWELLEFASYSKIYQDL